MCVCVRVWCLGITSKEQEFWSFVVVFVCSITSLTQFVARQIIIVMLISVLSNCTSCFSFLGHVLLPCVWQLLMCCICICTFHFSFDWNPFPVCIGKCSSKYLCFEWGIAKAKCILATAVCVSVCLSLATFPRGCMEPDVIWGNGRVCPLVVHYWADLQSVHGFCCYVNIHVRKLIALYMCTANAYSTECEMSASACTRCMSGFK